MPSTSTDRDDVMDRRMEVLPDVYVRTQYIDTAKGR